MNAPPRPDESYIPTEVEHIANVITHMVRDTLAVDIVPHKNILDTVPSESKCNLKVQSPFP